MKTFSPLKPHFRKRVVPKTLLDNKLRIPAEFMRKYGTTLSDQIVIKVPSGEEWEMGLTKHDGDVWLGKGWLEFAKHHSLENEQTLFFKYKGCSKFKVVIINKNGSEIDYPILNATNINESDVDIGGDDDDDGNVSEKLVPPSSPQKIMRRNPGDIHTSSSDEMTISKSREMKDESDDGESDQVLVRNQYSLSKAEKAKELSRTKYFTSQNPYFMVVIQKTHLHPGYKLEVPSCFWREHLSSKSGEDATLYVSNGRTSRVKLYARVVGKKGKWRAAFRSRGWKKLAQSNNLEIRDVCIFDLVDENNVTFNVSIDRCNQKNKLSHDHKFGKPPSKDHARGSSSTNPYFKVELRASSCEKLHVPHTFAEKYFEQSAQNVTLQVGKRMWQVTKVVSSAGHIFSDGWPAFSRDNTLQPGNFASLSWLGEMRIMFCLKLPKILHLILVLVFDYDCALRLN